MGDMNPVRRVTFREVPSPAWTGWENPFQDGSDVKTDAEEILSLWRRGALYQWDQRDLDSPQDDPVTVVVADIKPTQNDDKDEKSSKLYRKFLKWKEKVKLVQNFFKVR